MIEIHEIKKYSVAKKPSDENAAIEYCLIGDIVDMQSGVAFKKSEYSNEGVRLFQIANVSFNYIKWEEVEHLPEDYVGKYPELLLEEGNIVMALNRPLLNDQLKIAQIKKTDTPAILYQRVGRFKFIIQHNPRYFLYFLQSPRFIKWLKEQLQGVNIPFINKSKLLGYNKYPKHTVDEQTQIVSKIEELFSELDKGIEELKTAKQQLKVYRQAVLKWAFEGKLTNEDVKDGELPKGWKFSQLAEVVEQPKYGTSKKCDYKKVGKAVLRIPNIKDGMVDDSDLKYAEFDKEEIKTYSLKEGDLLTIRSNGSVDIVGQCALITKQNIEYLYAGYLIRLRPIQSIVNPRYLLHVVSSSNLRNQIESKAKSTSGVNNINSDELKSLIVPICSIEEQQQIVQEIESRLSVCDKIEETITDSLEQAEALRQSILKKAFEGKLVKPNYEQSKIIITN